MRYISDDGKVFNTEQECYEYEQKFEKEQARKEQLKKERQNRLDDINKKYKELQKLVSDYDEDYSVEHELYFRPIYELLDVLYL